MVWRDSGSADLRLLDSTSSCRVPVYPRPEQQHLRWFRSKYRNKIDRILQQNTLTQSVSGGNITPHLFSCCLQQFIWRIMFSRLSIFFDNMIQYMRKLQFGVLFRRKRKHLSSFWWWSVVSWLHYFIAITNHDSVLFQTNPTDITL